MKKLLVLLLTLFTVVSQGQFFSSGADVRYNVYHGSYDIKADTIYNPNVVEGVIRVKDTAYYLRISDAGQVYRQQGYGIILPRDYDLAKTYPVWLLIHGTGERSQGKLADLRNVVQGFDYNGDGIREEAIATNDFKKAINTYQFIGVVPTYGGEFNPTDVNFVLNEVESNYSVDKTREAIIGFSLGGGAVVRYVTSSQANADRLATAIACAPVNWGTNYSYIKNTNLPFIAATNQTDKTVSPGNAMAIVANSNALNPIPATKLIIFPKEGHGSINEMLSLGYADFRELIYLYLNRITNTQPQVYGVTGPVPPVEPPPVNTMPVIKIVNIPSTTSTGLVTLDACSSTGYEYITWTAFQMPAGVNAYTNVFPGGAGACKVTGSFKTEGTYGLKVVACKGSACTVDSIYIAYQKTSVPVPVTAVSWESITKILLLSDGTRIKSECVISFTGATATVTTEQGITYTLKK